DLHAAILAGILVHRPFVSSSSSSSELRRYVLICVDHRNPRPLEIANERAVSPATRVRVGLRVTAMGSNRGRAAGVRSGPFRAHARRNVRLRALVTHVQAGWQRYAPVDNIGLGGACVHIEEGLVAGDSVPLSVTAPTL